MDTPTFITFMVMWMLLFFGILAIILTYRHSRHVVDLNHKERMAALERGLELPPPSPSSTQLQPRAHLQRGLVLALLGLSLMAALGGNAGLRSALWGLPLTALGLAYLAIYFLRANQEK